MAKRKKNQPTKVEPGASSSANHAARQTSFDPKMPCKPKRLGVAPGESVHLVSNMYKITNAPNKSIYCHAIEIENIDDRQTERAGNSDQGAAEKPLVQRKIPRDLRRQAATNAIREWLENNPQAVGCRDFVLDANASTLYSLFKMLDVHDARPSTRASLEIKSFAMSKYIVNQAVSDKQEQKLVRIFSPSLVNVPSPLDFCAGDQTRSSLEVHRAINAVMSSSFLDDAKYLCMPDKTGSASVFPYNESTQFDIDTKGLEGHKGFTMSARTSESGLVAVISNTSAPFYQPWGLLEILKDRYKVKDEQLDGKLPEKVIENLERDFKTIQIEATHINYGNAARPHYRKYRLQAISRRSAEEEMFEARDATTGGTSTMSVSEYFRKMYPNSPLRYPHLPCVVDNKRMIPLEVCRVVDKQRTKGRLKPDDTKAFIKEMVMKPERHFKSIQTNANDVSKHSGTALKAFGLKMEMEQAAPFEPKPIELEARELSSFGLKMGRAEIVWTNNERGSYDDRRCVFLRPATVRKWALVILADEQVNRAYWSERQKSRDEQKLKVDCNRFSTIYSDAGKARGVNVGKMAECKIVDLSAKDELLRAHLREGFEYYNANGYEHIIFVLPDSKDWLYSYLQYLEVDVPRKQKTEKCTRASIIKTANFIGKILRDERSARMFLYNLWLKYNTKLGGVNKALAEQGFKIDPKDSNMDARGKVNFLQPGYLFVSIDVCHPAPGDRLEQSVAAAVGTWDITSPYMSHCTRVRVQRKDRMDKEKSTVEQVLEIDIMFKEILESYKLRNKGNVPTNIVILRDGVSEGQFKMVLNDELRRIKACLKNFCDSLKKETPPLACLTVQKRHKVRFMRKPSKTFKGSKEFDDYNVKPGTVIDNTVVPPMSFSFYLAPHKAIRGTSRAPHVSMIYDEIKFSQDAAQAMIFALSYLSPRCNKGTSIPAPVNLADLAAERGKNIVVSWSEDNRHRKLAPEERLSELNAFLSTMGDSGYHNTLYYV